MLLKKSIAKKLAITMVLLATGLGSFGAFGALASTRADNAAQDGADAGSHGAAVLLDKIDAATAVSTKRNERMLSRNAKCTEMVKAGEIKPGAMSQFRCLMGAKQKTN